VNRYIALAGALVASGIALTTACAKDGVDRRGANCAASADGCSCHFDLVGNSYACSTSTVEDSYCCAWPGWPREQASCSCEKFKPKCFERDGSCTCSRDTLFGDEVSTCYPGGKSTPAAGSQPGRVCCADGPRGECSCESGSGACLAGRTEVPTCTAGDVKKLCSPNYTEVNSCTDTPTSASTSSGSTGSSGSSGDGGRSAFSGVSS
jgi:hypothetical protein